MLTLYNVMRVVLTFKFNDVSRKIKSNIVEP